MQWRLDAIPAHVDNFTFQVVSINRTIIQCKGFINRHARLESQFYNCSIAMCGEVSFLMRDSMFNYKVIDSHDDNIIMREELLPEYFFRIETTRFKITNIIS